MNWLFVARHGTLVTVECGFDCGELHRQVLERDGWRCQTCGSMQHLQVHHLKFRGQSGGDVEQNLITLCADCHARLHQSS
jgi:predicted HNH restriction endonuclease